jgi:hypothetical protein
VSPPVQGAIWFVETIANPTFGSAAARNIAARLRSGSISFRICNRLPYVMVAASKLTPVIGMAEALVKLIKRDYASVSPKPDAPSVLRQLNSWFEHYNSVHHTMRWATARHASSGN